MKYQIIILVFINLFLQNIQSQDLEEVVVKPSGTSSVNNTEEHLSDLTIEAVNEKASIQEETQSLDLRASTTYKKEEYLHAVIREEYYQKITTNHWSKYFNGDSWKRNVLRSRYWSQLRNYLSGNDKDVIVIRTPDTKGDLAIASQINPDRLKLDDSILPENSHDSSHESIIALETQAVFSDEKTLLDQEPAQPSELDKTIVSNSLIDQRTINENDKKAIIEKTETQKKPVTQKELTNINPPKPITRPTKKSPAVEHPTIKTASNFASMKGALPWPVRSGTVTDRFGIRKNAEARGLRPENYGIDMVCSGGTIVQAVSNGTVLLAKRQSPYDYIVTIKHGQFTTAYYFLITPYVKAGDQITVGQNIGQLRTSVEQADFHFEIWQNQDRVNPELWLKKR